MFNDQFLFLHLYGNPTIMSLSHAILFKLVFLAKYRFWFRYNRNYCWDQRVMWAIVTTERPSSVIRRPSVCASVNFSHVNQLLWSHWANLSQTLVEWSLDGPLPKMCPGIPTSNQDGRQAKNRKKEGW